MIPIPLKLTALILLATVLPVYGQSMVYCPTAPEERRQRCARVNAQIDRDREQIAFTESQLRDPEIVLARVEMHPEESLADYRARVEKQQGAATPGSNTWLPVQGHYYNPVQQRMYVALKRTDYWRYIWESLAFDPELAQADFQRRERRSRREKTFQLEDPESAINRLQYSLETQLAFQRECCTVSEPPSPMPSDGAVQRPAPLPESR
ncbi:MAG: hypothetical protein QNJ04_16070 [Desulfobacterales bacterium]|nr:hypothetical protein [Desulfobacterales bacterium]